MAFCPDYGLALFRSGVDRDFQSFFYTLHLNHISATAPYQFTTLFTVPFEGCDHALSLDFSADALDEILEFALPETASRVRAWVRNLSGPGTLDLPESITFGARATLGVDQQAEKEIYVPLIIQEVFP
jgi:hypothetical protein